jgi:hypothetical protein
VEDVHDDVLEFGDLEAGGEGPETGERHDVVVAGEGIEIDCLGVEPLD